MKVRNIPFVLLMFVVVAALFSCHSDKKEKSSQETDFEQAMGAKDTLAVLKLIDEFFGYAESGQYNEAAMMLYRNDTEKDGTPIPLDNDEMEQVKVMLRSVPMVDYTVEYIKFNEYYANEVLCKIIIREAEGDIPAITTKMFFKPVFYLGNWVLCLTNTEYGDRRLVPQEQGDSMAEKYKSRKISTSDSDDEVNAE